MSDDRQPRTPALAASLARFDSPTVANAIEGFGIRDRTDGYASSEIRCEFPELGSMAGYAVTCTLDSTTGGPQRPSRLSDLIDLLAASPKPAVVVCQYVGSDRVRGCFLGDLSAALYQRVGAIGVVTDAPNRDLPVIQTRAPGFHVLGTGSVSAHGNGAVIDVDVPVVIGGLRVRPGDLVHGDANGVIVVPLEIAAKVATAAERVWAVEQELFDLVANPNVALDAVKARFKH
jgi:4-hydroxy-4-methyl-2-oxoglutarate aldolase